MWRLLCLMTLRLVLHSGAFAQMCPGDCNLDEQVTIDEVVTAVNIALGTGDLAGCQAVDASNDGQVTVDELVTAVSRALQGCIVQPTPTPTRPPGSGRRCSECLVDEDCNPDLGCFECSFNCTGNVARCAPFDEFIFCEDGEF